MFLENLAGIGRVMLGSTIGYFAMVLFLRGFGKRTLAKMNAFDFVVTIALGSMLSSVALMGTVPLAEGLAAILTLITLQYVLSYFSVKSTMIEGLVKSNPRLLYYRDRYLEDSLKGERVTKEEVSAAIRKQGVGSLDKVSAVVLETDGSFSVIKKAESGDNILENFEELSVSSK